MAVLRQKQHGRHVLLNARHLIGRLQGGNHTCIPEDDISRTHATISWNGGGWQLRDQSRNGTLVNSRHIVRDRIDLSVGDQIKFGKGPAAHWEVVDDAPPASYLQSLSDDQEVLALTKCAGVPNPDDMSVSIFYDQQHWVVETAQSLRQLQHNDILAVGGKQWRFVENEDKDITRNYASLAEKAIFCFNLSADEERIGIEIVMNDVKMDLGERVYHYLLLALARKRMEHAAMAYPFGEEGWMDLEDLIKDMSKEMRKEIDPYYLNVQIYRLRKQLNETEPLGYMFSNVVERKRGMIRFSAPFFKIFKENECISEMPSYMASA